MTGVFAGRRPGRGVCDRAVWWVACELVRACRDDAAIIAILLNRAYGISEQSDPKRAAQRAQADVISGAKPTINVPGRARSAARPSYCSASLSAMPPLPG